MAELSTLARPYAKAAFDYANENSAIGDWEDFLVVASSVVSDSAFEQMLENPAVSAQSKVDAIIDIYDEQIATPETTPFKTLLLKSKSQDKKGSQAEAFPKVSVPIKNFIQQLAEQERLSLLPQIHEQFVMHRANALKQVNAHITTAYPLTGSQRVTLQKQLEESLNATVILHENVDSTLIAGATIKIGDKLVDDSVRGKLKQLKTQLTA